MSMATLSLRRRMRERGLDAVTLLVIPGVVFVLALFIYPFLYGLVLSFTPKQGGWLANYQKRWNAPPADYSITAYDAALVVLAAIETVAMSGAPVTRAAVRDAIQAGKVDTLQGSVAFDANGDLNARVVSVFQVQQDTAHPVNDVVHQFKYIGVALADNS